VAFGEELVRVALLEPAARLRQLAGGGEVPKEDLRALLMQASAARCWLPMRVDD
jgi:hypothetical protein